MATCTSCGSTSVSGRYAGQSYCKTCIRDRTLSQPRTIPAFADISERLAALGLLVPEQALGSFARHSKDEQAVAAVFSDIAATKDLIRSRVAANKARERFGDAELSDDLTHLLDSNFYYLHHWLAESDCVPLVRYCAQHTDMSLLSLLSRLDSDQAAIGAWDGVRYALLGSDLAPAQLLASEQAGRLGATNALAFALGLSRMVELAHILRDGYPPPDRFSDDERDLLLTLESSSIRRASRTWHLYHDLAADTATYNDRAEIMMRLWLLYPTKPPLSAYLKLLYGCYVRGQDVETVILCRAVLERAITSAHDAIAATVAATMNERITQLRSANALSVEGARRARDVWARGSKAVHQDPASVKDPLSTIESTLRVASELASFSSNVA
jgi:hypothetical protein